MKKFIFVLILSCFFIPNIYAENTNTKQISKKDWEEYQQYKKEQADNVSLSDDEYEQYQQYLKEKQQKEETNNQEVSSQNNSDNNTKIKEKITENEIIIMFGKILNTSTKITAKNSYYGTSNTTTNSDSEGWKIDIDGFKYIAKNTAIGAGISCFSNFKSNETRIFNIDVMLKQRFPMNFRDKTYLYLTGGLGYGHFTGTTKVNFYDEYNNYAYYIKLNNGFHWMLSFGIDFTPFIIDLNYSCNYYTISTDLPYTSGNGSVCSLALSVGYKFNI